VGAESLCAKAEDVSVSRVGQRHGNDTAHFAGQETSEPRQQWRGAKLPLILTVLGRSTTTVDQPS
jgi:hypothetical protein